MRSLLELNEPIIDWVKIAEGMGVPAVAVTTAEDFHDAFELALGQAGPRLIEATIEQDLQPVIDLILQQSPKA